MIRVLPASLRCSLQVSWFLPPHWQSVLVLLPTFTAMPLEVCLIGLLMGIMKPMRWTVNVGFLQLKQKTWMAMLLASWPFQPQQGTTTPWSTAV